MKISCQNFNLICVDASRWSVSFLRQRQRRHVTWRDVTGLPRQSKIPILQLTNDRHYLKSKLHQSRLWCVGTNVSRPYLIPKILSQWGPVWKDNWAAKFEAQICNFEFLFRNEFEAWCDELLRSFRARSEANNNKKSNNNNSNNKSWQLENSLVIGALVSDRSTWIFLKLISQNTISW